MQIQYVLQTGLPTLVCALLLWGISTGAHAQHAQLESLQVERTDDKLLLSARVALALPAAVADALHKGIPVHFVAQADVRKARWYWSDETLASARRYMRVSYQPLTQRWRLSTSSSPMGSGELGLGLAQHYDSLDEVLNTAGRIVGWPVATTAELDAGGRQTLRFRYRLDASQLPRALQIGEAGKSDWVVAVDRRIDLTQESEQP